MSEDMKQFIIEVSGCEKRTLEVVSSIASRQLHGDMSGHDFMVIAAKRLIKEHKEKSNG